MQFVRRCRDYFSQPRWWVEVLLIWGIYEAYSRVRNTGGKQVDLPFSNGDAIQRFEHVLGIGFERSLNQWVHENWLVADLSALAYHTLHWWVTIGVVVWLFWRRKDVYRRATLVLIFTTLMALAGFFLLPTAPPRMFPGYTDIMAQTSSWGWWGHPAHPVRTR